MAKREDYRRELESIDEREWEPYLLDRSGLPGPRGNLELAQAVADLAPPERLRGWAAIAVGEAPTGSREEFLAFCGTVGLGRLATEGDTGALGLLRRAANDQRWRVREAAAMALQRIGLGDFDGLAALLAGWVSGTPLERRAVVAALCEPALLTDATRATGVLDALDAITAGFTQLADRRGADVRTLRQALGYGWSVAVAALPAEGRARMQRWLDATDPDIRWIMRENLRKKRLARLDLDWVGRARARLDAGRLATPGSGGT